jgi:tRNA (cmo5U34)-methyltransferase
MCSDQQTKQIEPANRDLLSSKVDDLITTLPGNWKFDEQVAQNFDSHVVKSIPLYADSQKTVVDISDWFIRNGSIVYDIGSATGETLFLLAEKHRNKNSVQLIGIESSNPMIQEARKKCTSSNIYFLNQDVTEIRNFNHSSLITSLYTIQFLPFSERKKLFEKIYSGLLDGGAFILAEKVRAESSFFEDLWLELHWDYKARQGLSSSMIIEKAKSLRGILDPLPLSSNIKLLRSVGFGLVEVITKWCNFVTLVAVKGR